jgi:uncharacterized protein (TIGR00299 family) protein
MHDMAHILEHLNISAEIKTHTLAIFDLIAQAESQAHGCTVEQVHFHEVGQLDALADILAACMLINELSPDCIMTSPVCVGHGTVQCAHGILPVPAPATSHILTGVPIYAGNIAAEMCTPTGAAILRHFTHQFAPMPPITPERTGYGLGTRDFSSAPNMIRATWGQHQDAHSTHGLQTENLVEICTNLDDMTPEQIAFAADTLLNAGALDVWTTPIVMKKGRSAHQLSCLVPEYEAETFVVLMLKHTATFGVRLFPCQRYALPREIVTIHTEHGPVRQKQSKHPDFPRQKWEHEDLASIARQLHNIKN